MPKKKKRRQRKAETIRYLVSISDWNWGYSFGLNFISFFPSRFSEYAHLELAGTLLSPKNIKAEHVEVTLMPDHRYNADKREEGYTPDEDKKKQEGGIGGVSLNKGKLEASLTVPADMFAPVLSGIIAGHLKYITMSGGPMRYRQGSIRRYDLSSSLDPEDWPEASAS